MGLQVQQHHPQQQLLIQELSYHVCLDVVVVEAHQIVVVDLVEVAEEDSEHLGHQQQRHTRGGSLV